eukprot:scaffold2868_cov171-Amphora_coffeaeformis.AAC.14
MPPPKPPSNIGVRFFTVSSTASTTSTGSFRYNNTVLPRPNPESAASAHCAATARGCQEIVWYGPIALSQKGFF